MGKERGTSPPKQARESGTQHVVRQSEGIRKENPGYRRRKELRLGVSGEQLSVGFVTFLSFLIKFEVLHASK